jgi:hypothetical protein
MGKKHGDQEEGHEHGHEHGEACAHDHDHAGHDHGHEHGEECDHGHGDDDDDIVELEGPDGSVDQYYFLGTVEVEGEVFALLTPTEEPEGENTDVFVFHYEQDEDGAECYEAVDDDELLAKVQEAAEKLFSEAGEEEE